MIYIRVVFVAILVAFTAAFMPITFSTVSAENHQKPQPSKHINQKSLGYQGVNSRPATVESTDLSSVKLGAGGLEDAAVSLEMVAECELPTKRGPFRLRAYRYSTPSESDYMEPVVLLAGDIQGTHKGVDVPVRIHDQCLTSEVLGSRRCDCRDQLELSMEYIHTHGGAIIYMQQEGRGIGLANKVAAYALQDHGMDTVDANRHLGFEDDLRSYEAVPKILKNLGIKSIRLLTNNPYKVQCLSDLGVEIQSTTPIVATPNFHNIDYLRAKASRMSHRFPPLHLPSDNVSPGLNTTTGLVPPGLAAAAGVVQQATAPEDAAVEDSLHHHHRASTTSPSSSASDKNWCFGRHTVEAAIDAIRQGKMVVVVDDENRENEGDLIMAAELASKESLAFMIKYSSGVVCCGLEEEAVERLDLPQMVTNNQDPKSTAFTVTVDAAGPSISTGISAGDRALTLRLLAGEGTQPSDLHRPGHIFPLRARDGGVLTRRGHTEAAVDLSRLAGLAPAGVLVELTTDDGMEMARLPELQIFVKKHGLVLTSIQDLVCYRQEMMENSNNC
mmetsp:Transcript_15464/g.22752  ORF Transcript_15464/g.22752 Transcript_15464/m.22752 type:complete len:557 (-) Transcript_15464:65-1735(-)